MDDGYWRPPTKDDVALPRRRASRIHTRDKDFMLTDLIAKEEGRDPNDITITDEFKVPGVKLYVRSYY